MLRYQARGVHFRPLSIRCLGLMPSLNYIFLTKCMEESYAKGEKGRTNTFKKSILLGIKSERICMTEKQVRLQVLYTCDESSINI